MPRPRKLSKSHGVHGEWSRWDQYVLLNDAAPTVFRAQDARLNVYDPWTPFRRNEGAKLTEPQPYLTLLNLSKQIQKHPNKKSDLVLDWCNHNGLLGILPAFADRLWFPPVALKCRPSSRETGGTCYQARRLRYVRSGGLWQDVWDEREPTNDSKRAEEEALQFDGPHDYPLDLLNRDAYVNRRFSARFFPTLGELSLSTVGSGVPYSVPSVPLPGSPKFFDVYGEQVGDIAHWASGFEQVVKEICVNGERARSGALRLADLASAASPTFRLSKKGDLEEVRVSAGLLASFALMILWDLEDGRRVFECKNCGKYFASKDARAGYCSVMCRNTAQSRRYRAKKRTTAKGD